MWPYGDLVPGGYMAKVSLPVFCTMIALAVNRANICSFFFGLIAISSIFVTYLTGERTHTVLRYFCGVLSTIIWKPKIYLLLTFLVLKLTFVAILLTQYSKAGNLRMQHYTHHFFNKIQIFLFWRNLFF